MRVGPAMQGVIATAAGAMLLSLAAATQTPIGNASPNADDLGVIGPSWPIKERDLLEAIHEKLRDKRDSGAVDALGTRLRRQALTYAAAPPSLHLPRAKQSRIAHIDPSIVVPYDIRDADGHRLYPAGTTVNPLERYPLDQFLLFIDGDDPDQRTWLDARLTDNDVPLKVILTGGSPGVLSKSLQRPVYFDQDGLLVHRFGIEAVPASVQADPRAPHQRLLVQEHDPKESPDG
ncbi:MAG: type-F conjugative transfer system protein TraW [Pseudomonadota bacterium]|nr:type-F conjugative transfer system protein TraW [Pseudomonadota bacterium]